LESIPCRVFTSSRRSGVLAPAPASSRFSAPSTTSPGLAPCCDGPSRPVAVPLPGFLSLSAVSWHVRAKRPCFVPLPPVGFSLQSVAPRRERVRLSASLASLQFSTAVPEVRRTRPVLRVSPTPALVARWPGFPPELGHRFHHPASLALARGPATASPIPWASCAGTTPFRRLRLLRSFAPPASPCSRRDPFGTSPWSVLSWALPLQSLDPVEPRTLA